VTKLSSRELRELRERRERAGKRNAKTRARATRRLAKQRMAANARPKYGPTMKPALVVVKRVEPTEAA
jgi:hypothetical protein